MLSKLFTSAKSLFNPTPQTHVSFEPSNSDMVTTRQQIVSQEGASFEDPIVVDISRSSKKRSRKSLNTEDIEEGDEIFETPAKKKKALPLRERDDDGLNSKKIVVEIPASKMISEAEYYEEGGIEREDFEEEDFAEDAEDALGPGNDSEEDDPIQSTKLEISKSKNKAENKLAESPTEPKAVPTRLASPIKQPYLPALEVQPRHKRFGSEGPEPEPQFFSTALEILDTDEESSEDDAPEVVGAQAALANAQSKAREAAKAVYEQETAIRKKRQEKDAKLKEQAETAARKREIIEKKIARRELKQAKRDLKDSLVLDGQDVEDAVPGAKATIHKTSKLPDLLPDEYLQDEDDESLADSEVEITRSFSNKKKFPDLVQKQPKDRKVGSTTYRVSESRSEHLAPKSSLNARNTKEAWMNGRGPVGAKGARKVTSVGFFKK